MGKQAQYRLVTAAVVGALAVGVTPGAAPAAAAVVTTASAVAPMAVRTDLNGQRFIDRRTNAVYLVIDGRRSWVPDPATYRNLFLNWNGIKDVIDIQSVDLGPSLSTGAFLGRAHGRAEVYLVSNGVKRHVTSMAAMDRYYFSMSKVVNLPPLSIDSIPTGAPLS